MDWLQNIATRLFFNSKNPIDAQETIGETEDEKWPFHYSIKKLT